MRGRVGAGGWFALGTLSGVAVAATAVALWTVMPVVCNAKGYFDSSPIRLVLPVQAGAAPAVMACFALDCSPRPVEPNDAGDFLVPQVEPYLDDNVLPDVGSTGVYVRVIVDGVTVADNRFGIEAISDTPFWSRCPGPFHYGPVTVG